MKRSRGPDPAVASGTPEALGGLVRLLKEIGSVVEIEVDGGSMAPTLADGAAVRIHCTGAAGIRRGDVVAFLAGGRELTIHRVVATAARSPFAVTRGDANVFCDPPLPYGDIVGKVVARRDPAGPAEWEPVPDCPARGGASAVLARINGWSTANALSVHVRLGQAVAVTSLALVLPRAVARRGRGLRWPPVLRMLSLRRVAAP